MSRNRVNCTQCDELISEEALKCPFCRSKTSYAFEQETRQASEAAASSKRYMESKGLIWDDEWKMWRDPKDLKSQQRWYTIDRFFSLWNLVIFGLVAIVILELMVD